VRQHRLCVRCEGCCSNFTFILMNNYGKSEKTVRIIVNLDNLSCVISGFYSSVNKICTLEGFYTAENGCLLSMF